MSRCYITTRITHVGRNHWKWAIMDLGVCVQRGDTLTKPSATIRAAKAKDQYLKKLGRRDNTDPQHAL